VVPALLTGQFSIAEAKAQPEGTTVPVGVVLWASVSPEVDKRLSEQFTSPVRLRPDEWRSGDQIWLIDAAGDPRVLNGLMQRLGETSLKGRKIKSWGQGEDGKPLVRTLSAAA
jgi:cytolysin-activating lysine-acyltransferase